MLQDFIAKRLAAIACNLHVRIFS